MLVFGVPRFFFPLHNSRKSDVRGENQAQFSLTKKEESQFSRFFFSKSLRSINSVAVSLFSKDKERVMTEQESAKSLRNELFQLCSLAVKASYA